MRASSDGMNELDESVLVEGFANVVAIDGETAWLEPEQTSSCGSCAASSACAAKGMGTLASRLEDRRFPLANDVGLVVGEKVVIGIQNSTLVQGSLIAYGIPLATMWLAAGVAQSLAGKDMVTMTAMAAGLAFGLGIARLGAARLSARGTMAPHFLRRAGREAVCFPLHARSDR
jgi:sigma-E factor negative regulatory protein RseC